jgi:hypothetical protein
MSDHKEKNATFIFMLRKDVLVPFQLYYFWRLGMSEIAICVNQNKVFYKNIQFKVKNLTELVTVVIRNWIRIFTKIIDFT